MSEEMLNGILISAGITLAVLFLIQNTVGIDRLKLS